MQPSTISSEQPQFSWTDTFTKGVEKVKDGLRYARLFQKNLFGARIVGTTKLDIVANGFLTSLHVGNGAQFVDVNHQTDSYVTTKTNFTTLEGIIVAWGVPLGLVLKGAALFDREMRKALFDTVDLQYEELKEHREIRCNRQDNSLGLLPKTLQKMILHSLDTKDVKALTLTCHQWGYLGGKELFFRSLKVGLQQVFNRHVLEKAVSLPLNCHRAGYTEDEYFVQSFNSKLPPSSTVIIEPKQMKNESLAKGRDPWGRPYLALHLVYQEEKKESILVLQPQTNSRKSAWQTKETFMDDQKPKTPLSSWLPKRFEQCKQTLDDLVSGKSITVNEGENQSIVYLWSKNK